MKFINDILAFLSGVGEKSSLENLFKETKIPNILLYLVIVLVGFGDVLFAPTRKSWGSNPKK